jgi:aspartyl protease family protein
MLSWAVKTFAVCSVLTALVIFALAPQGLLARWLHPEPAPVPTVVATVTPTRTAAPNEYVFRRAADGHYYVDAEVNGARIHFLIDTGASVLTLSPDDARAAGLNLSDSDFTMHASTANGVARIAPVVLREVDLNQITLTNVSAAVVEVPMPASLLGMSFLSRLAGYEVRDDELVLRW